MSAWKKQANADSYVDGVRAAIPLIAEQVDLVHRLIDGTLAAVERVLDLGCGDGALTESILTRHPGASAVLVDFSAPMLARARDRFAKRGYDASFVQADLAERSWQSAIETHPPFDLVISGYAIHHLAHSEKQALFRDIVGLLQPGGLFLNLEHVAPESSLGRKLFDEMFIDSLWRQASDRDPDTERDVIAATYHGREDQDDNILATVEDQCRWLREAGLVDVDCYFKFLELALLAGRKPA